MARCESPVGVVHRTVDAMVCGTGTPSPGALDRDIGSAEPIRLRSAHMVADGLPPGVIARIVEVLEPEEVWLFGSRARQTHGPDSDWDLMAILPDSAPDEKLDVAKVWGSLRDLLRMRVEVIPMRRRDFDEDRHTLGELAEAVAREGRVVYGR